MPFVKEALEDVEVEYSLLNREIQLEFQAGRRRLMQMMRHGRGKVYTTLG